VLGGEAHKKPDDAGGPDQHEDDGFQRISFHHCAGHARMKLRSFPSFDHAGRAGARGPGFRDPYLDVLKGIAIATVVLGHTFQGATPDYGNYLPFRIVYSFHMPMFMFVAGMAMSAGTFATVQAETPPFVDYVARRALRLVVPFIVWAAIKFIWVRPVDSPLAWLSAVFREPDNALWFLLVLFEVSVVVALSAACARLALRHFGAAAPASVPLVLAGCLVLGSGLFWLSRYFFPSLGLAILYIKYVCLGILYRRVFAAGLPATASIAALLLFAALSPFWVWNGPPALDWHPALIDNRIVTAVFDFTVALSGTLALVEAVRLFVRYAPNFVLIGIAFCGGRTLDIYALHFYYLGFAPPVVGPIVASLIASFAFRQIPFAAVVLFGDAKYRPTWVRAFSAWRARRAPHRA
jgi:fucose 4-O-acetylase-like acetyltransferase